MSVEPPISFPLPALFATTTPPPELLTQGAEALLFRTHFLTASSPSVLKYRPSKTYRHPTLDKRLTRHRILSEARTLVKCRREGVPVPAVLGLDADGAVSNSRKQTQGHAEGEGGRLGQGEGKGGWMMMEYIPGKTVRETLQLRRRRIARDQAEARTERDNDNVMSLFMQKIGRAVGRLHEVGVVHGDLTTSNMILRPPTVTAGAVTASPEPNTTATAEGPRNNGASETPIDYRPESPTLTADNLKDSQIILIDFGLATQTFHDEERAVDLYVLERAFGSTHPEVEASFQEVLRAYGQSFKGAKVVLKRLEDVRMRGRKRSMLG